MTEDAERRDVTRWQRRLLPFMSRFLVVLAIGFFIISLIDVYQMRAFVKNESATSIRAKIEELLPARENRGDAGAEVAPEALLLLEADALDKRYRQASALLMSRIWTRELAFITGMVLAFVGSVFIIGKLSESKSDVTLGTSEWKTAMSSTSPGLILAFFGTVLMGIALVVQPEIKVEDHPVYFTTVGIEKNIGAASGLTTGAGKVYPDPLQPPSSTDKGKKQKTN